MSKNAALLPIDYRANGYGERYDADDRADFGLASIAADWIVNNRQISADIPMLVLKYGLVDYVVSLVEAECGEDSETAHTARLIFTVMPDIAFTQTDVEAIGNVQV